MTTFIYGLGQAAPGGSPLTQMVPFILMIGVFYFLLIRPQSKKAKLHQQMLKALRKGDDVVTTGGLIGRITGLRDEEITIQIQEGVRVRVLRSAIQGSHNADATNKNGSSKAQS